MKADIGALIWCLAMWIVPLAGIGLTELVRRKRDFLALLHPGAETRSDPSAEMWSAAMRPKNPASPLRGSGRQTWIIVTSRKE